MPKETLSRLAPRAKSLAHHVAARLVCGIAMAAALATTAWGSRPTSCIPQDLDASGAVDGADLGLLLDAWGRSGGFGPADFDSSGAVDGGDLGMLLAQWGEVPLSACLSITGVDPPSG